MSILIAIILQVGPPAPACIKAQPMPIGVAAPCAGGWLVPRSDIQAHTVAAQVCEVRIDAERRIGAARVEQCATVAELAHAGMIQIGALFEAGQVADSRRLVDVVACPWYRCPGWAGVVVGVVVGAASAFAALR